MGVDCQIKSFGKEVKNQIVVAHRVQLNCATSSQLTLPCLSTSMTLMEFWQNCRCVFHYQKLCHMQPHPLQLGCNCLSHAIIFATMPPFWVCMQLWCNYDHLHPNLWMISVTYHRIYLICIYSQLHVQPKQANYGLLVSQVHIFCNQRQFFQTQLENA